MPLVKTRGTSFALFRWYVRWKMELFVIDALDFEARRKAEVTFRNGPAPKDVHLWLYWDCWPLGDAVEVDAVVMGEERVVAVSETTCCFFAVEAGTELDRASSKTLDDLLCSKQILLLRLEHLRLLFEHQQLPFVQSTGNELEVCIREVV